MKSQNNDLANNYGNLCQRVFTFLNKNCESKIPSFENFSQEDEKLFNNLINKIPELMNMMDNQNLNLYMKNVINFSFESNKYFNDSEPWSLKKNKPKRMNTILYVILNQIKSISILLNPVIPISTDKVLNSIGIDQNNRTLEVAKNHKFLKPGSQVKELNILFKKIENDN